MWIKNISLSQNKYYFNLYEFLKRIIHALVGELDAYVSFRRPYWCPFTWKRFINLVKTFYPNILHMKYCTDLILGKAFYIFIFLHFPDSKLSVLIAFLFFMA